MEEIKADCEICKEKECLRIVARNIKQFKDYKTIELKSLVQCENCKNVFIV